MPRPSNKGLRRSQIIDALTKVMAERGYDGASIQAIASEAGLAPGLVHYHFANKEEILLASLDELGAFVLARYEKKLKRASSPRARLYAFTDAHVALGKDARPEAVACWVAIGAEAFRKPRVQKAYRTVVERELSVLTTLVEDVLRDEHGRSAGARGVAAALLSAIYGAFQLAGAAQALPPGFAAPALRSMAAGLIAAEGGRQ